MKQTPSENVYLLFLHEPYHPGPGTGEINTTVVAAASLLHPQVPQPDGARIHHRLTQGREPGEIVPLAVLTHEPGAGADDWTGGGGEKVTAGLVQLVRTGQCDALSLGLSETARTLLYSRPNSHVRAAVLARVDLFLACLVTEHDLWPGEGLLPGSSDHPSPG